MTASYSRFPQFEVHCAGPHGKDTRVYMDGNDISRFLHGVELTSSVHGVNQITLHGYAGKGTGFRGAADAEVLLKPLIKTRRRRLKLHLNRLDDWFARG